jgi:hypothetical protein
VTRKLTVALIILFAGYGFSQDCYVLKGTVVDFSANQPLPFAQISVSGSALGTVTNEEGLFNLNIPFGSRNDTLLVSYLGFATAEIPVSPDDTGILVIFLKPVSIELREVEIIALTPEEVLRRAFDSIPVNYGSDPVLLTGFIRTRKTVNKKLAEYTEAIVEDLKDGYYSYKPGDAARKHQLSNIPLLYKGRVNSDTNLVNMLGDVGASARCLGCNFVNDIAEFPYGTVLDERDRKHYLLAMDEMINPEGGKIYRIRFDQDDKTEKMLYQGEILIDSRDFAVMRITYKPSFKAYDAYEKNKDNRAWFLNGQSGWIQEMPLGETTITYSKRGETWTLSTIRSKYWVTYSHPQNRQKINYGYTQEVVVTDATRDPEVIATFAGDKSIGVNQRWDELVGKSDEAFWEHFNYLPIEETLKKEIEAIGK